MGKADLDWQKIDLFIEGREEVHLWYLLSESGELEKVQLFGIGDWKFLQLLQSTRSQLKGKLDSIALPGGDSPGALLLREAILKMKGQWNPPYLEEELCHCRGIPTAKVDAAILAGAHEPRKVSEETSASTACGTCRPNVLAMIEYRLKSG